LKNQRKEQALKLHESVSFHNNLNKIPFSKLNEVERSLAMMLLIHVKEKGSDLIEFSASDLKSKLPGNYTEQQFKTLVQGLHDHFFNIDFETVAQMQDGTVEVDYHHLFNHFTIVFTDATKKIVKAVRLQVNPPFLYIVNDLVKCFTTFELREFCLVQGKYAKDIYRLLKQYKSTGEAYFDWQGFIELLGIGDKSIAYIENKVLKRAVLELSRNIELETPPRPAFRNLAYEKIREEHTRGRPVKGIRFTFEPEQKKTRKTPKAAAPKAQGVKTLFTAEKQRRRSSK